MQMSNEKEIQKLKEDIEFYKNKSEEYSKYWRLALTENQKAKQDEINVARFNIARIITKHLDKQIRTMCFYNSIIDDGQKSNVLFTLNKLKQEMNIEFEDGIFYYYSKNGDKLILDGVDYNVVEGYNKDWMK
jgi:hypothetical protein